MPLMLAVGPTAAAYSYVQPHSAAVTWGNTVIRSMYMPTLSSHAAKHSYLVPGGLLVLRWSGAIIMISEQEPYSWREGWC